MNVVDFVKGEKCTGCGACIAACPKDALLLSCNDADWHLHPKIDRNKCIECAKCVKICPAQSDKVQEDFVYGGADP